MGVKDVGILGSGYCEDHKGLSRLGSIAECKEAYDMRDTWRFEEHGQKIDGLVDAKAKWTGEPGREWTWMAAGCVATDNAAEVYFNAHEQPLHSSTSKEQSSALARSPFLRGTPAHFNPPA